LSPREARREPESRDLSSAQLTDIEKLRLVCPAAGFLYAAIFTGLAAALINFFTPASQ